MKPAPTRPCPLCGSQDDIDTPIPLPEGGWQLLCGGSHGRYVFEVDLNHQLVPYPEEIAADLELAEDLATLVRNEHQLWEYGVVEHLYGMAHRKAYDKLVKELGHVAHGPLPYSTSSVIAATLGRMAAARQLDVAYGPGTGYWTYNSTVSCWCPAGAEPQSVLTWERFAEERGFDPKSWPLLESTRVERYWAGDLPQLAPGDPIAEPDTKGWDGRRETLLESVFQAAARSRETQQ